jgi:hypothetical protein
MCHDSPGSDSLRIRPHVGSRMRHLNRTWQKVCAYVLFAFICNSFCSSVAISQTKDALEAHLKGMRNIEIQIYISQRDDCKIEERIIRNDLINKIIPAGLIVVNKNYNFIEIKIMTVSAQQQNNTVIGCASSVEFNFFTVGTVSDLKSVDYVVHVSLFQLENIMTSSIAQQTSHVRGAVGRYVDDFLANWRQANAGADFVRTSPPVNITPPSGPNIRIVQQRLKDLRLYHGVVDGIAGGGTAQAVQAFQRSQQLPATGDLDLETMRRLFP